MNDWLSLSLLVRLFAGAAVLSFVVLVVRVINSAGNELEWADLISTPARNGGRPHADWNKIGQGFGVVLCVWLPAVYVYSAKMEAVGLAAVMSVALLYLGGVSAYAATLRARQGSVTTVTEPAPDPAGTKTTITELPPVAGKNEEGR